MPQLLFVNPSVRPSQRGIPAAHRQAALSAMAGNARPKKKRKKNPTGAPMAKAKKKAVRKSARKSVGERSVASVKKSPRKHKAKRKLRRIGKISVATGRKTKSGRRKYKSKSTYAMNPISAKGLMGLAVPAVLGAAGAIGLNLALQRMTFLPATLTTGYANYLTRAAVAVGVGFALAKFKVLDPAKRNALVGGALVVTAYDAIMDIGTAQGWFGATGMNGYEYIDSAMNGYQNLNGLGFVNSAPITGTMTTANSMRSTG